MSRLSGAGPGASDQADPGSATTRPKATPPREAVQRWRLVMRRAPGAPALQQKAWLAAWEAALVASGLPLAGLDTPAARPRFAVAAPLATGLAAEAELLDVLLVERLPRWRVREALEPVLPEGHALADVYDAWLGEPPLPGQVVASEYRASVRVPVAGLEGIRAAAAAILAAESVPRTRPKGDSEVAYDLRPFVDDLSVGPSPGGAEVRMRLVHDPERGIGRPDEVLAELGERTGGSLEVESIVRERLVLRGRGPVR